MNVDWFSDIEVQLRNANGELVTAAIRYINNEWAVAHSIDLGQRMVETFTDRIAAEDRWLELL